jgi:hypothetical protein
VGLRPVPARLQPPAVDDVADEVEGVGVVAPEEVEKQRRLAAPRAEMHVRDEERADADRFDRLPHRPPPARLAPFENRIRVSPV